MAILRVLRDPFANALRGRAANQAPVASGQKKNAIITPEREAQLISHQSDPAEHRSWYCHGAPRGGQGGG